MLGSCFSSSVNARFRSPSSASLIACADTRRARAPPGQADALKGIRTRQHQPLRPHVARQSLQDGDLVVGVERSPSGEEDPRPHPSRTSKPGSSPERTRDGIAAARKRGRQPGRPPLDPETVFGGTETHRCRLIARESGKTARNWQGNGLQNRRNDA